MQGFFLYEIEEFLTRTSRRLAERSWTDSNTLARLSVQILRDGMQAFTLRAMPKPQQKQKLYCYVDETGQDTEGRLFLVAVVVTGEERDELRRYLTEAEERSGKRSHKWSRSTPRQREGYIRTVLNCAALEQALYYSKYEESRAYVDLTVLSVAKAINIHTAESYAATILVDGLHHRTEQHRFAHGLRALRIRARKVRGLTDESDAFIRLADALAGFVRDSLTGDERMMALYKEALMRGMLREV